MRVIRECFKEEVMFKSRVMAMGRIGKKVQLEKPFMRTS
jgi:hypothetical protein